MIYTPTIIEGRWYADGGVVDNFPVRLLAGRCDVTLGSHLRPIREVQPADLDSSLRVTERALEIGMYAQARERYDACDVVIVPEGLDRYGLFDSRHIPAIEAAGYEAAQERMDEIVRVTG
jgi:NTE family protein